MELIERIAYEYVEDASKNHIIYAENRVTLHWTSSKFCKKANEKNISEHPAIKAMKEGKMTAVVGPIRKLFPPQIIV